MFAQGYLLDNKYRIGRLIGQGGMGAVYEAEAILLHRRVAIKVQSFSHGVSQTSGEMAMRFQLEAQAAGRIGSRHIVDVIDLGRLESGEHFMVMEYLDGQSLRERIDTRGAMSADQARPIALQLLAGVAAAHAAGIVHRDLKPENVFLVRQPDGSDFVKILDFGISKFNDIRGSQGSFSLTRTGALMGTPRYLSPEQATGGKAVDQRTDIYMVGVILYECMTGSIPYEANTFNELLFQIVQDKPRPIQERIPGADPNFAALIECAMQKDPKHRFQSAEEMSEAIRAVARGEVFSTRTTHPSGAPVAPAVVPFNELPVARLSTRSGMAPPPNESAAKSWSQSHAGAGAETASVAAGRRSKLPWIGAAAAVVLAGAAFATILKLRPSTEDPTTATAAQVAPVTATAEKPSEAVPEAKPVPAAPVVPASPAAAPSAAPARPNAGAATRRDPRSSSVTARQAAPPAATEAPAAPPAAAPGASASLPRIQGGGRIIRGKL